MFEFLKKKTKPDPRMEEQNAKMKELSESLTKVNSELDSRLDELEAVLKKFGYMDMDFELLKSKSYLKVIK